MGFASILPLIFGIAFQTPLVMLFLERIGILTVDDFRKKRKIAILVITIAAAVLTPGQDPISMLLLALPMIVLYEIGILLISGSGRKAVAGATVGLTRVPKGGDLGLMSGGCLPSTSQLAESAGPGAPASPGTVYLVGAGPGDPGLLTRRGEAVLSRADVVVYDHLASASLLELAPRDALLDRGRQVDRPLHAHARKKSTGLDRSRARRADRGATQRGRPMGLRAGGRGGAGPARRGHSVRDRAGGDGGGRRHGVRGHPGHPSGDRLGRRVCDRTRRSRDRAGAQPARLAGPGALPRDAGRLHGSHAPGGNLPHADSPGKARRDAGGDHRVGHDRRATRPGRRRSQRSRSRHVTRECGRPALLVVGDVVGLRDELTWYERLPLFGQRIVVTRPRGEAARAAAMLEALGAEVLAGADGRDPADRRPGARWTRPSSDSRSYQWLVFTSANGVRFFMRRLHERGRDLRALGHLKLAAIGPETAKALGRFHLTADLVPESYRSEALAAALARAGRGRKILLARADRGRTLLKDELDRLADVDQVAVYHIADVDSLPASVLTGSASDRSTGSR